MKIETSIFSGYKADRLTYTRKIGLWNTKKPLPTIQSSNPDLDIIPLQCSA